MLMPSIYFGGDYNPEQWDPSVWREDMRLMRTAGVNLVTLGVFSWSSVESSEGKYDFGWMDEILGLLHESNIAVDLATGTASIPNWAVSTYPDIVAVDAAGLPYSPGSRQYYSPSSPSYRRLARNLATAVSQRYADHPAVVMWHVNNEYACHVPYDYSDAATARFRHWLQARYRDIDTLNQAWNTAFWSQRYWSFGEVFPPRRTSYSQIPGLVLDYRRFTSDNVLELFVLERDAIRDSGAQQPITTNFMDAYGPLDYWRWAQEVDFVSNDNYSDPRDPLAFRHAAFGRDLMRSLKPHTPWVLMEQATNAVNWRASNAWKAPNQMAAWSEQAVARGASGVMFFQWRQSLAGAEKFHSAMLPHAGPNTRVFREVCELGVTLSRHAPTGPSPASVGLILDWDSRWAIEQSDHPAILDYESILRDWYNTLHEAHISIDFVPVDGVFDDYRLVVAPALYLLRESAADALRRYVEQGGVLVTTAFTDIVDEYDRFRIGGFSTQLAQVLGAQPVDFAGVLVSDGITFDVLGVADRYQATGIIEELQLAGAEPIGWLSGELPAIVRHRFGEGVSIHVATFPDPAGVAAVLSLALQDANVGPVAPDLPSCVEAVATAAELVIINHSCTPTQLPDSTLQPFEVRRIPVTEAKNGLAN